VSESHLVISDSAILKFSSIRVSEKVMLGDDGGIDLEGKELGDGDELLKKMLLIPFLGI
jgi:hypothetical protein